MGALLLAIALLVAPAAHAASAGAPPDDDASRWLEWLNDPNAEASAAGLRAERGSGQTQLERIFGGSMLSLKVSAGGSATLDQSLAASVSVFSLVDTSFWYAFNRPGANLLARRFGGGVGFRPGRRTRIAFDYEHALPENQYGANLFWVSWTADVASGARATKIGAWLGRLNFTDNSSFPLVNQTALRLSLMQEASSRLAFTGSYTYYSEPHGPVEAENRVRLVTALIEEQALSVNLEQPKTFELLLNARYLVDEANEVGLEFTTLRYHAGVDQIPENPLYAPSLTYTRLLGKHLAIDVSATLLIEKDQPANPSFGLQTTLVL